MDNTAYIAIAVFAVIIRVALFYLRVQDRKLTPQLRVERPAVDDPRWQGSRGTQMTGRTCVECDERIVIESDGKPCKTCSEPVHKKTCAKRHRARTHALGSTAPYR